MAQEQEQLPAMASIIREFFIDFLSSLVPGFLFTIFAIPMAISTAIVIFQGESFWTALAEQVKPYHAELWCLTLVLSYVLGSVFSRQDPKKPDQKSAAHILFKDWAGRKRSVIQLPRKQDDKEVNCDEKKQQEKLQEFWDEDERQPSTWFVLRVIRSLQPRNLSRLWKRYQIAQALSRSEGGQFPYSHLSEYLKKRGLDHLEALVPWKGASGDFGARSKMFINILKVRLQFSNQKQCGEIIRNEAHVRMMSSVWYAARQLERVYLLFVAMIFSRWGWPWHWSWNASWIGEQKWTPVQYLLVLIVLLVCASRVLRRVILEFLHYQRVREIVYVLETAYTAFTKGNTRIFEGLKVVPPSSKLEEKAAAPAHEPELASVR